MQNSKETRCVRLNGRGGGLSVLAAVLLVAGLAALGAGCSKTAQSLPDGLDATTADAMTADYLPRDWTPDYPVATGPCHGYNLLNRPDGMVPATDNTLLLDMEGKRVQGWSIISHPIKMLPGGSVIGDQGVWEPPGSPMPEALSLQQQSWDGVEEWAFSDWDDAGTGTKMSRQHHDFEREGNPAGYYGPGQIPKPKGTTLVLAHKEVNRPKISAYTLLDDPIYEVGWDRKLTGFVWYPSDHIDEMGFDKSALDTIKKNPNYIPEVKAADWLHLNTVSILGKNRWYEQHNDQRFHPANIIIDSREANFIAIISRKTGKIVWRVGPEYGKGMPGEDIGQIIGPHMAHMIPHGLPGAGNILVFDNGGGAGYGGPTGYSRHTRLYSRVVEFNPITLKKVWEYGKASGSEYFYSPFISGAQRLPNGNTLITPGDSCEILEVTWNKKRVWSYTFIGTGNVTACAIYRAYRVPPEWLPKGKNVANYPEWSKAYPPR